MFDTFRVDTRLPPDAALHRIRNLVRAPAPFWRASARDLHLPFVGEVKGYTFEFQRDIGYRNSFLPRITGRVVETQGGSRVEGEMWIHPLSIAFMTVWISGGLIAIAMAVVKGGIGLAFGPLAMVVAGVGILALAFVPEVRTARRIITAALDVPAGAAGANCRGEDRGASRPP